MVDRISWSGNGDDVLRGGDGSDEYYVELGAGTEKIIDSGGAADRIVFGPGISAANISTEICGNDHVDGKGGIDIDFSDHHRTNHPDRD